jgi:hypothetical protein
MNRWVGHGIFAAILAASIAVDARTGDVVTAGDVAASEDIVPAVLSVARSNDLFLVKRTRIGDVTILTFRAPGCARPVVISPLDVSLDRAPVVLAFHQDQDRIRYRYLDRASSRPERMALFIDWKIHKALGALRLSRYVPSPFALLTEVPRECWAADSIDWRPAWDRRYLARLNVGGQSSHPQRSGPTASAPYAPPN